MGSGEWSPHAVAHPERELAQLVRPVGKHVGLQVEQELQPVFDLAQEPVGVVQPAALRVGQTAGGFEGLERPERVAAADRREVAAVQQLQELDRELDVPDAPGAGLHLSSPAAALGLLLDLPLHRLDLVDLGKAQEPLVDERLNRVDELRPEGRVAGHRADLDERLALPRPAEGVVIRQRTRQRPGQRAALTLRAKAEVHAVRLPLGGQQADEFGRGPAEELVVPDRPAARGLPFFVVHDHQVDVAGVVQLAAAELPEAQDRGPAAGFRGPVPLGGRVVGGLPGDRDGRVGRSRQVCGDLFQRPVADHVVDADPQQVPPAEPAEGPEHAGVLGRGGHVGPQACNQLVRGRRNPQRGGRGFQEVRVGGQDVAEELRRAEQLEDDAELLAVVREERWDEGPGGRLGEESFDRVQGQVRVGRFGQEPTEGRVQVAEPRAEVGGEPLEVAEPAAKVFQAPGIEQGRRGRRRVGQAGNHAVSLPVVTIGPAGRDIRPECATHPGPDECDRPDEWNPIDKPFLCIWLDQIRAR